MKILFLYADSENDWNCSEWRCAIPTRAINRSGKAEARMKSIVTLLQDIHNEEIWQDITWADVIVIERAYIQQIVSLAEAWKADGKKIILDVDDAYHLLQHTIHAFDFWIRGNANTSKGRVTLDMAPAEQLFLFGKLADAVCTPSWRLCQDWTKYHNQVYLIPNFLETQAYLDCPKLNAPISGRVVGWAGSTSHIESFRLSSLPEAIKKLLRDRDDVYVYIAGGTPALRQITNHSHYVASGYVPFKDYPGLLKLINVGLIPLAGEYDNRRSILKALEYMILGIPWVGSNVELLQPLKEFGVLTANRRNEWVRAITWVLDEPQDKVIQRGIELAQLYDIDNYGVDYRLQIYEEIFNAKSTKHQIKPNFEQQLTPWAHLHASA